MAEELHIPDLDLKTDVEITRLEGLLKANEQLDLLRDRSQYIHERYDQRPKTFYELCARDAKTQPEQGDKSSTVLAIVTGVAMGSLLTHAYRNIWPRQHDIGYIGGIITGGTLGGAYDKWQQNKATMSALDRRIDLYEDYLNRFERAMQAHEKPPEDVDMNRVRPVPAQGR